MSTCESPVPLLTKSVSNKSDLPDLFVKQGLTLCSNDPSKYVYDQMIWDKFPDIPDYKGRAAYIKTVVDSLAAAQKNYNEVDLPKCKADYAKCEFSPIGSGVCNATYDQCVSNGQEKFKALTEEYNAMLAAIRPLTTDTGNPNSEYNYFCDSSIVYRCTVCKNNYAGSNCDKCAKGFGNLNGEGDCSLCNDDYCSGHGRNCVVLGGIPKCTTCDAGFGGNNCGTNLTVCPGTPGNPCNGRGKCNETTGLCACSPGYSGPDCSGSAPLPKPCPKACSGRGVCNNLTGECACNTGFVGEDCSGAAPLPKPCLNECSGRGVCNNLTGECACNTGFVGEDCSGIAKKCQRSPGDANVCSGNGKCVSNGCNCFTGWSGAYCDLKTPGVECPSDKSGNLCGNKGSCVGGKCRCKTGWQGNDCSSKSDSSLFMWLGLGLFGVLVVVLAVWWRSRKSTSGFGVRKIR